MKQPKRPTRNQKEIINSHGLNANNWMIQKESEFYLYLINKESGKQRIIDKFKRGKNR